jgi:hypothetical protein
MSRGWIDVGALVAWQVGGCVVYTRRILLLPLLVWPFAECYFACLGLFGLGVGGMGRAVCTTDDERMCCYYDWVVGPWISDRMYKNTRLVIETVVFQFFLI